LTCVIWKLLANFRFNKISYEFLEQMFSVKILDIFLVWFSENCENIIVFSGFFFANFSDNLFLDKMALGRNFWNFGILHELEILDSIFGPNFSSQILVEDVFEKYILT